MPLSVSFTERTLGLTPVADKESRVEHQPGCPSLAAQRSVDMQLTLWDILKANHRLRCDRQGLPYLLSKKTQIMT